MNSKQSNFITLLIPTYNSAEKILYTWSTVLKQSDQNFKVIFRDDCSTDNTVEILEEIAKNDDRVLVIKGSKNVGLGQQRIELTSMVQTEYFMFLDDDDHLYKNTIKEMKNVALKTQSDLIGAKTKIGWVKNNHLHAFPNFYKKIRKNMSPLEYYTHNMVFYWGILIKTSYYQGLKINILPKIYEDNYAMGYIFLNAKSFTPCNIYSICYVKRKNTISAFNDRKAIERLEILHHEYEKSFALYKEKLSGVDYFNIMDEKGFTAIINYIFFLDNVNKANKKLIFNHFLEKTVPLLEKFDFNYKTPLRFWKWLIFFHPKVYFQMRKLRKSYKRKMKAKAQEYHKHN